MVVGRGVLEMALVWGEFSFFKRGWLKMLWGVERLAIEGVVKDVVGAGEACH